jgi:glycine/D-amino acid oxidase-like deaminating enzyme
VYIVPHGDGTTAVGSTTEREFSGLETDAQLDGVIATACAALPALADARVIARWAGLRPRTRSRAPMLPVRWAATLHARSPVAARMVGSSTTPAASGAMMTSASSLPPKIYNSAATMTAACWSVFFPSTYI